MNINWCKANYQLNCVCAMAAETMTTASNSSPTSKTWCHGQQFRLLFLNSRNHSVWCVISILAFFTRCLATHRSGEQFFHTLLKSKTVLPAKLHQNQLSHFPPGPGFWALDLRGEGIPQILDIHFQIALTSGHVAGYGWIPFSELGD